MIIDECLSRRFAAYHADCVEFCATLPDDSIGLSVFSPPFSHLFVYSDSERDMGNNATDADFLKQYSFLARELLRVTKPGRIAAVHCSDLPRTKASYGAVGLYDLPGDLIRAHEEAGWTYHSRVTIWKDPVVEMTRTKALGLLHKQLLKDSTRSRQGMADYLLIFRKTPDDEADADRVSHVGGDDFKGALALGRKHAEAMLAADLIDEADDGMIAELAAATRFPVDRWQKWASPVWMDIDQTRVLNVRIAREDKDEKHLCPLQLDVIERVVWLWSKPGDTVLSPFMGIGSEGYVSIKAGRRFIGTELKESYFRQAVRNLQEAEAEALAPKLFEVA